MRSPLKDITGITGVSSVTGLIISASAAMVA